MALNIRNLLVKKLVAELARITEETRMRAVTVALSERLSRLHRKRAGRTLADELDAIAKNCANSPMLDNRTEEEILGYNDQGLRG